MAENQVSKFFKTTYNLLCTTMQFSRKSQYKTYSETDVVETLQEMHKEMIPSLVKIQLIASDFHR